MSNIRFTGIMPALVTPFDAEGKIKKNTVRQLIDWQLQGGVKGFYICGSTGEGPALRPETRIEMAETVMDVIGGRGVVINHIGAPNMHDAIMLAKHATDAGVNAISSLAPTYSFPYTEDELVDYYKAISDATDKPVIVYATAAMGVDNFSGLMARLIEIPNVIGVKFTIRDYFEMRKTKEVNGGDVNLINGPDETLLCGLVMGADGGIGTTYNIMPEWYCKLYDAFRAGDIKTAQEYQYRCNRVTDVLIRSSKNGAIKATKAALDMMGFDVGPVAGPGRAFDKDQLAKLKADLSALGIQF